MPLAYGGELYRDKNVTELENVPEDNRERHKRIHPRRKRKTPYDTPKESGS